MEQTKLHIEEIDRPSNSLGAMITADQEFDRDFKPTGAIAFFVLLVILGLIIWYGIYFLMLERI